LLRRRAALWLGPALRHGHRLHVLRHHALLHPPLQSEVGVWAAPEEEPYAASLQGPRAAFRCLQHGVGQGFRYDRHGPARGGRGESAARVPAPLGAAPSLHHVAVGTRDVEALGRFYSRLLGVNELARKFDEVGALRSIWLNLSGTLLMLERTE